MCVNARPALYLPTDDASDSGTSAGKSVSPPCQSHLIVHEMQREVPS
jgi:hypothetical protein